MQSQANTDGFIDDPASFDRADEIMKRLEEVTAAHFGIGTALPNESPADRTIRLSMVEIAQEFSAVKRDLKGALRVACACQRSTEQFSQATTELVAKLNVALRPAAGSAGITAVKRAWQDLIGSAVTLRNASVNQFLLALTTPDAIRHRRLSGLESLTAIVSSASEELNRVRAAEERLTQAVQAELLKLKNAIAEATASTVAVDFVTEAKVHQTAAERWTRYSFWTAVVTAIVLVLLILFSKDFAWQDALARIAVLTLGYAALHACIRMALSHRHNQIVLQHRALSLKTASVFLLAAGTDDSSRREILLKSAGAIFDAQPTGFSKAEIHSSESVPVVQQLIQPLAKSQERHT